MKPIRKQLLIIKVLPIYANNEGEKKIKHMFRITVRQNKMKQYLLHVYLSENEFYIYILK